MTPLVTLAGTQTSAVISPDGNEVAFVYSPERSNKFDIYLKGVHDDNFVRITNGAGSPADPAFSPDGQQIAYSYCLQSKSGILERSVMLMSRLGGNRMSSGRLLRMSTAALDGRLTVDFLFT